MSLGRRGMRSEEDFSRFGPALPPVHTPTVTGTARPAIGAALAVVLFGSLTVWASFLPWASIADFDPLSASGVAMGEGVVTAMLGLVVAIVGAAAVKNGGRTDFRTIAVLFATTAFAISVVDIVTLQVAIRETRAGDAFGPRFGVHLTAAAAAAASIAALQLIDAPAPKIARRRALLLVLTLGWCLWAFAATDRATGGAGPLMVGVVTIIGIGVAMLPGRLPWTRIRPRSLGIGIVAYGVIASLQQLPLSDTLFTLLPVAVIASLVGSALLDLPITIPVEPDEPDEPADSSVESGSSASHDATTNGDQAR